jgi:hypothetical protein
MGHRVLPGLVILLAAVSPQAIESQATAKLALDATKPIVYIQFDHAGPRQPVEQDEPATGLWLRLVNNTIVPIEVKTDGTDPERVSRRQLKVRATAGTSYANFSFRVTDLFGRPSAPASVHRCS